MDDIPWDIINEITSHIKGYFIAWTSTCKSFYTLNTPLEKKKREAKNLEKLINLFPDKNWDYEKLASNPGISAELIFNNPRFDRFLINNPHYPYIVHGGAIRKNKNELLYENPNLTWEFIYQHSDFEWNWILLSQHKCITWEIVQNNPKITWNYNALSSNPNISFKIIAGNPDQDWSWERLTLMTSMENIDAHVELPWNYEYFENYNSFEPDITEPYAHNPYSYSRCIDKLNIDEDYTDLYNDKIGIDEPKIGTVKEELDYITTQISPHHRLWYLNKLSKHPNTRWSDILENPNQPWDFQYISANFNITWEIVRDHQDKRWDWEAMSENTFGLCVK